MKLAAFYAVAAIYIFCSVPCGALFHSARKSNSFTGQYPVAVDHLRGTHLSGLRSTTTTRILRLNIGENNSFTGQSPVAANHITGTHLSGQRHSKTNSSDDLYPDQRQDSCGVNVQVTEHSQRGKNCPAECPLYVHDSLDSRHCTFQCVSNLECLLRNPDTSVPDTELGTCRPCKVAGCKVCSRDGTDTCLFCKDGYKLSGGRCEDQIFFVWYIVFGVVACMLLFVLVWLVSLFHRQPVNLDGVKRGQITRTQAKLHKPAESEAHERTLYPFFETSLLTEPVAGIGVMHLFRFEFALILWASAVLLAWLALGFIADYDYFRVGVRSPGETARDNCIIVAWGYVTQNRLLLGKVAFVAVVYVLSFAAAMYYSVHTLRAHQRYTNERVSHKGYCAMCVGLPKVSGKELLEEKIQDFMEQHMSQLQESSFKETPRNKVVGVSVCWDFTQAEDDLMYVINLDSEELLARRDEADGVVRSFTHDDHSSTPRNNVDSFFLKWEMFLLSPGVQRMVKRQYGSSSATRSSIRQSVEVAAVQRGEVSFGKSQSLSASREVAFGKRLSNNSEKRDAMRKKSETFLAEAEEQQTAEDPIDPGTILKTLYSTDTAFVVFETRQARDAAVDLMSKENDIEFQFLGVDGTQYSSKIHLEPAPCEPQAVQWNRFQERSLLVWAYRISCGILCIALALLGWLCVYYPYASSVLSSDYANGTSPSEFHHTMFGLIVIGGNALMYVVCSEVADRIGFRLQRQREQCYLLSYFFACVSNVVLDLIMAYAIAYKKQVGMGMTTYHGTPLGEVSSFNDIFETYAMQKSLGQMLLDYSFPATFLIPFLVEPFVVIGLPLLLMSPIVARHPFIKSFTADAYLASTPMDLSRYADVMLNVMLAVLMFFFPGGYILYIFGGLVVAHVYIFNYDRFRVLRSIPTCDMSSRDVDLCAQWMFSVPCGLLLSCVMFKANCEDLTHVELCYEDHHIIWKCWFLFLGHIALHTLILFKVVPLFGIGEKHASISEPYRKCAEQHPCSWFSANPIHCLRSNYIYEHTIPCGYLLEGYDWLLQVNEKLNLFYYAPRPRDDEETYDIKDMAHEIHHKISRSFSSSKMSIFSSSKLSASSRDLSKSSIPEDIWQTKSGYIAGTEILREQTTIKEAKLKCKNLDGCIGFYFQGPSTLSEEQEVEIRFCQDGDVKSGWSYTYTSFLRVAAEDSKDSTFVEGRTPKTSQYSRSSVRKDSLER